MESTDQAKPARGRVVYKAVSALALTLLISVAALTELGRLPTAESPQFDVAGYPVERSALKWTDTGGEVALR